MENVALFIAAALLIALTPGPGILYVAGRALSGGRAEGIASSVGTGLGGLVHVVAGALGVSALLAASATGFAVLKFVGAGYLVWLGVQTWRAPDPVLTAEAAHGARRALREGILVEAMNPKTAVFFLAFLPQFVDPALGPVGGQFVALGLVSVALNTGVDVLVVLGAARVRAMLLARAGMARRIRHGSAALMCALGLGLALARKPG